ncbi:MAG: thiamine phosphate synthase [Alistipes sp.]|nr:thiamine phosphate synthase [Alistipes sp.]
MMTDNFRLQFITHCNDRYTYVNSARIALEGGCRWIQLRMKNVSDLLFEESALVVQRMCKEYGATFIIDDNVALAKRIGADGVHLGKSDMPILEARAMLGKGYIIGGTVNTFEDIKRLLFTGAPDYFGCGPFRFTSTKKNLAPVLGVEGYAEIVAMMREQEITIPIVAIGGITKYDISKLLECGVSGIALSGSILNACDPIKEMRDIISIIYAK